MEEEAEARAWRQRDTDKLFRLKCDDTNMLSVLGLVFVLVLVPTIRNSHHTAYEDLDT